MINNKTLFTFILRIVLGFIGSWLLCYVFFTPSNSEIEWLIVLFLSIVIISAAYLSAGQRTRQQKKNKNNFLLFF